MLCRKHWLLLTTIRLNCVTDKLRSTIRVLVDVVLKAFVGDIHLTKACQNFVCTKIPRTKMHFNQSNKYGALIQTAQGTVYFFLAITNQVVPWPLSSSRRSAHLMTSKPDWRSRSQMIDGSWMVSWIFSSNCNSPFS